jgi:hypothetical protein
VLPQTLLPLLTMHKPLIAMPKRRCRCRRQRSPELVGAGHDLIERAPAGLHPPGP